MFERKKLKIILLFIIFLTASKTYFLAGRLRQIITAMLEICSALVFNQGNMVLKSSLFVFQAHEVLHHEIYAAL